MNDYRIAAHAVAERVGQETVLLNLNNGRYYGLDEVGSRMLELYWEAAGMEEMLDRLESEYDATRERLRSDLFALLDELQTHGLLERQ